MQPSFVRYVCTGLEITMKDDTKLYVYISKKKLSPLSIELDKEKEEAENIKKFCDKIIQKYK